MLQPQIIPQIPRLKEIKLHNASSANVNVKKKKNPVSFSLTSVTAWMDAPCFSSSSITLILFFLQAMWSGVKPFYRKKKRIWMLLLQLPNENLVAGPQQDDWRVNKALFPDEWKHVAPAAQCLADLSFYSFLSLFLFFLINCSDTPVL